MGARLLAGAQVGPHLSSSAVLQTISGLLGAIVVLSGRENWPEKSGRGRQIWTSWLSANKGATDNKERGVRFPTVQKQSSAVQCSAVQCSAVQSAPQTVCGANTIAVALDGNGNCSARRSLGVP